MINSSIRKWLIITIEIAQRELVSKLITANYPIDDGWGVILGSRRELLRSIYRLPKGIFLVKSASRVDYPYLSRIKRAGHKIVCFDVEGLVQYNYDYFAKTRITRESLELLDLYLTWGERQAVVVKKMYPDLSKKIRISGSPMSEIWKNDHNNYNISEVDKLKEKYGDFLAIPTSFGNYNHYYSPKKALKMQAESYNLKGKYLKKKIEYFEYVKNVFQEYISLIPQISQKFPKLNILIKVHPSEKKTPYLDMIDKNKNIFLYDGERVDELLMAAKVILQTESSTAIQSYLIKKIVLSYVPFSNEKQAVPLPLICSFAVGSKNELLNELSYCFNEKKSFKNIYNHNKVKKYLQERIYNYENSNFSNIFFKNIKSLDVAEENIYENKSAKSPSLDKLYELLIIFRNRNFVWKLFPRKIKTNINIQIIMNGPLRERIVKFLIRLKKIRLIKKIFEKELNVISNKYKNYINYGHKKKEGLNINNIKKNYRFLWPKKSIEIGTLFSKEIIVIFKGQSRNIIK